MKRLLYISFLILTQISVYGQQYLRYHMSDNTFNGFYSKSVDSITYEKINGEFVSITHMRNKSVRIPIKNVEGISIEGVNIANSNLGQYQVYEIEYEEQHGKTMYIDNRGTMLASMNGNFGSNDTVIVANIYTEPSLFITNNDGRISKILNKEFLLYFDYETESGYDVVVFTKDNYHVIHIDDADYSMQAPPIRRSIFTAANTISKMINKLYPQLLKLSADGNAVASLTLSTINFESLFFFCNIIEDVRDNPENLYWKRVADIWSIEADVIAIVTSLAGTAFTGGLSFTAFLTSCGMLVSDIMSYLKDSNPDEEQMKRYTDYFKKKYDIQVLIFDPDNISPQKLTLHGGLTTQDGINGEKRRGDLYFNFNNKEGEYKVDANIEEINALSCLINKDIYLLEHEAYECWVSYECIINGLNLVMTSDTIGFISPLDLSPTIMEFKQTGAHYKKDGFENNNKKYSYKYNVAVTLTIESLAYVEDWGYVYIDPDNAPKHISLMNLGFTYTDERYAYFRNQSRDKVKLRPYVKYKLDTYKVEHNRAAGTENNGYWYGEEQEFELVYSQHTMATTLDAVSAETTSAKVACKYEDFDIVDGTCGVEYWCDENHLEKTVDMSNEGEIEIELLGLKPNTTYHYRAFIKVGNDYYKVGETKSFTTQGSVTNLCPDDNHPHLIDLGLPSGTKWSCCNVGASKPEDYGGYYSIGEAFEKEEYSWVNYPYRDINLGNDIAGGEYDVAHTLWGDKWKTPQKEQLQELIDNTSYRFETVNGISGGIFTANNGKSIFIPAAGWKLASLYDSNGNIIKEYIKKGEQGSYWSATQYAHREGDTDSMYEMYFSNESAPSIDAANNFWGMPIRAVQDSLSVTTGEATDIMPTSVTLNGTCSKGLTNAGFSVKKEGESDYVQYDAVLDETGAFSAKIEGLDIETKYVYYAFAQSADKTYKGADSTFTTKPLCPDDNHPHMIDLGLPSGTKWACCNVGASKPEDFGGYYAWAETEEKAVYTFENYAFFISNTDGLFAKLNIDIAGTTYDVATKKWGSSWQIPHPNLSQELLDKSTLKWIKYNGIFGQLFIGPSGKSIFVPASGTKSYQYADNNFTNPLPYLGDVGHISVFWSSLEAPDSEMFNSAYALYVQGYSSSIVWTGCTNRWSGCSVRPVSK